MCHFAFQVSTFGKGGGELSGGRLGGFFWWKRNGAAFAPQQPGFAASSDGELDVNSTRESAGKIDGLSG